MRFKVLLVAEMELDTADEAASRLDAFREAIQPASEYGITLYLASTADLAELSSTALLSPTRKA